MKFLSLLLSLSTLALATGDARCNADNCLRAVRASAFTTRSGLADCQSYLRTTVTPAISTVTESQLVSVTDVVVITISDTIPVIITSTDVVTVVATVTASTRTEYVDPVAKRGLGSTVIPTAIPAYATPCSGAVRYSSACSCVGATATTITAPTPITIVTVVKTITPVTLTSTARTTITSFSTLITTATVTATTTLTPVATISVLPQCRNVSAREILYTFGAPQRNISPYLESRIFDFTEANRDLCCSWAHTIPDSSVYFFTSLGGGKARCTPYVNVGSVGPATPGCPLGLAVGAAVGGKGSTGFGLAACYGLP